MSSLTKKGFTLIEMLVVMAIIAIVTAMVVPAATSMMMASRLTGATDQVVGLISRARQTAIAKNHTVEVRFYQFGDPELPGESVTNPSSGRYRAMQVFEYRENGAASAVTKVERLPDGIIIDSNPILSTLFDPAQKKKFTTTLDPIVDLPRGVGTNYNCMAFQFTPGGTTKLAMKNWYVTLHKSTDGDGLATAPSNYAAVQIEFATGTVKAYRP